MAITRQVLRWLALVLVVLGAIVVLLFPAAAGQVLQLPLYALFSTTRMVVAFLLSLVFAIAYGSAAAASKRTEEVLLPVLDILQSVPILGFFPIVFIFFSTTLPDPLGSEMSVIILIFTSMAWNMAFGVYEAISNLPHDLLDVANVFGLRGWRRFRKLQLPATIPKLVYNSILSWTVGWFYLVASEVFTAFGQQTARPGLGSYIANAGKAGNIPAILLGLAALAAVVITLDTFLWRPLSVWSERFRMDVAVGGEKKLREAPIYIRMNWLPRFPGLRHQLGERLAPILRRWEGIASRLDSFYNRHPRTIRTVRRVDLAMFALILLIAVVGGLVALAAFLTGPLPGGSGEIPAAIGTSIGRLGLAYLICLAWTIPAAAWLGHSKAASRFITPVVEVVASIPATALFPLIILLAMAVVSRVEAQAEVTALVIAIFAMQWYLLFNLLAGVRSIPADLDEAAKSFGVRGWTYWRRVLLPAITPSLLTGSITAWGAGWNALIVAEYLPFGNQVFQVNHGIGAVIDVATYGGNLGSAVISANLNLLYLAIMVMILVVLAMNKLLWRPLIKRASARYRMEI